MSALYRDGHRRWQDTSDARRLADRIEQSLTHPTLGPDELEFVETRAEWARDVLPQGDPAGPPPAP